MAELKSDPNVLNPILEVDQAEVDQQYTETDRTQILASQAQDELDRRSTGLTDMFRGRMAPESISRRESGRESAANRLATAFSLRINQVLENTADNFENAISVGNNATSAQLEAIVWNKRKQKVRNSIMGRTIGAEQSLQVAEGYLLSMKNVEAKIEEELKEEKERYTTNFERYNKAFIFRWQRGREGRFDAFQESTKTQITNRLAELRKNAEKIKTDSGKRVEKTGSDIKRIIRLAPSPDKAQMWQQILNATQFNRASALGSLDLSAFGPAFADEQKKIDFLEALIKDPEIKSQVANINESVARNEHQDSLIESAKNQEDAMATPVAYTVDNAETLKNFDAFKGIPPAKEPVNAATLVDALWEELYEMGTGATPFPESIFTAYHLSHNLMTPSVKLHILLNYLSGPANDWAHTTQGIKDVNVRQKLLRFMIDKSQEKMGDIEEWDQTATLDSIKELKDDPSASNTAVGKLKPLLQEAHSLDLSQGVNVFKTFSTKVKNDTDEILKLYKKFLDREDAIDPKDFERIKTVWDKVLSARQFLINKSKQWEQEKSNYNGGSVANTEKDYKAHRKSILDEIKNINARAAATPPTPSTDDAKKLGKLNKDLIQVNDKIGKIRAQKSTTEISGLSDITAHMDTLDIQASLNLKKDIKSATPPHLSDFSERVHTSLKSSFADELEQQYLEQWSKNDQYELLKKQKSGMVQVSFREVGTLTHLRFPQELNGTETADFRIERNDGNVITLVEDTASSRRIRITGPAVTPGSNNVTKNAAIFDPSTVGAPSGPTTGKHPTEAIITNIRLTA